MAEQTYDRKTIDVLGTLDDVTVVGNAELGRYEITTPNRYDSYWMLKQRDYAIEFQPTLDEGQSKDWSKKHFYVPIEQLVDSKDIEQFNIKIRQARKETRGINEELNSYIKSETAEPPIVEKIKNQIAFEGGGDMEVRINKNFPKSGFIAGEVLAVGKYFVLFEGREKDGVKYLTAIETNRFVVGKEFQNKEQAISSKFTVGHEMYVSFDNDGKLVKLEPTPYQKDLNSGMPIDEAVDRQTARDEAKRVAKELAAAEMAKMEQAKQKPIPQAPEKSPVAKEEKQPKQDKAPKKSRSPSEGRAM